MYWNLILIGETALRFLVANPQHQSLVSLMVFRDPSFTTHVRIVICYFRWTDLDFTLIGFDFDDMKKMQI